MPAETTFALMAVELTTDENGNTVPDVPLALRRAFYRTGPDDFVFQPRRSQLVKAGITPTDPEGDAGAFEFIDNITLGGVGYLIFAGSCTMPCFEALELGIGANRVFTGEQAIANTTLRTVLVGALDPTGRRKLRRLLRKSDGQPVSLIPGRVIAGHDPIEAARPAALNPEDVEAEVL